MICCRREVFAGKPSSTAETVGKPDTVWVALPDFLVRQDCGVFDTCKNGDTAYYFSFFDSRDSLIDDPMDPDEIGFVSLIKSYVDRGHTYKDKNGDEKPLPVSVIIKRFDRIDSTTWQCVDYWTNKFSRIITDCSKKSGVDQYDIQRRYAVPYEVYYVRFYFCTTKSE
jgi:hypothetical protein